MPSNFNGRPFTDVLGEIQNGDLHFDLSEALYRITQAVMETRKSGKLTVSLDVVPTGRGSVEIKADMKIKEPEHDRSSTTFFVGQDFGLTRHDPNQADLPLRRVDEPDNNPVRVATNET